MIAVNQQAELLIMQPQHGGELFQCLQANRNHLRPWHPWVDILNSETDVNRAIATWQQQHAQSLGFYAGIWCDKKLCGMVSHLILDRTNRWATLWYWLAAACQGRGLMTQSCQSMIRYSFEVLDLHRITIECATDNVRGRAIPERLGFKFEGVIREVEWLGNRFADHAIYGLLRSEWSNNPRSQ